MAGTTTAVVVLVVLALWPAPGKYPFGLPAVVGLAALAGRWRLRRHADDVGAALIGLATLVALATWTARAWWHLGRAQTLAVGAALLSALVVGLVVAVLRAGSADDPDREDGLEDE